MRKVHQLLISAALAGSACGIAAQTMKPGLWEINNKMSSSSGAMNNEMAAMQKELASMPPDQRKMMEGMMAKQGAGMGMGASAGALNTVVKVCMTPEMVERNEVATQQGDCKHKYAPRTGNTMKFSFACSKPPSSGEGQVNFVSPEAYSMKMTFNSTAKGKPESMNMDASGKFLSTECGSIKPSAMPRK